MEDEIYAVKPTLQQYKILGQDTVKSVGWVSFAPDFQCFAISVSPHVCFILDLILMFLSFYVSKILHI